MLSKKKCFKASNFHQLFLIQKSIKKLFSSEKLLVRHKRRPWTSERQLHINSGDQFLFHSVCVRLDPENYSDNSINYDNFLHTSPGTPERVSKSVSKMKIIRCRRRPLSSLQPRTALMTVIFSREKTTQIQTDDGNYSLTIQARSISLNLIEKGSSSISILMIRPLNDATASYEVRCFNKKIK